MKEFCRGCHSMCVDTGCICPMCGTQHYSKRDGPTDWNDLYNSAVIICAGVVIGFLLLNVIYFFMGGYAK